MNFANPVHESDNFRSTSTFQWSSMRRSCNTSKFVCVSPGHINVFQWDWESFFIRHVELDSRFYEMTINEAPSIDQKSLRTSASSCASVG